MILIARLLDTARMCTVNSSSPRYSLVQVGSQPVQSDPMLTAGASPEATPASPSSTHVFAIRLRCPIQTAMFVDVPGA